jgi:hypothetical protein
MTKTDTELFDRFFDALLALYPRRDMPDLARAASTG